MNTLELMVALEKPKLELFASYMQFIEEMRALGEKIWEGTIPKPSETCEDFITRLLKSEQHPEAGLVAATTYWAINHDTVVGRIQIRHALNDNLRVFGGHIGYEVRPSQRRQGIATAMLGQILATPKAKELGRLLLTCSPENVASNKTIVANGGVLSDSKFVETIHRQTNYYWIESKS